VEFILIAPLVVFCALWIVIFAYLSWALKQVPSFERQTAARPGRWPRLSVIVPARNEAAHLESAARTILSQDYPRLEVILVDDRSHDGTGALIDLLAREDARVKAIHIDILPDGWLGKVHALHRGVEHAEGEWLLFTDADVHFAPTTLRRAIAYVMHQQAEHLTLIPRTIQTGFWLDVAVRAFGLLFFLGTGAATVNRAGSRAFVGIGAFNLVKAETLSRTPGLEWLRLEPGDDVGLGMMIKEAGGITRLAFAQKDLSVEWYDSVPAMFRGLEKNLFGPGCDYRRWRLVAQIVAIVSLVIAPWVLLGLGVIKGSAALIVVAAAAVAAHILFALVSPMGKRQEVYSLLLFPAGLLMIAAMLGHAGYKCLKNDGIDWRDTYYPLAQLRAGQRVKLIRTRQRN
jgi:glycosyltransferase involved in cell wall biosynthesis